MQPFIRRKLINVLKCAKSSRTQCSWHKDSVCNVLPFVVKKICTYIEKLDRHTPCGVAEGME